jgi:hypothetical protein
LRCQSGNLTYNIAARRMISGLLRKYLNGSLLVIGKDYETALPASTQILLKRPNAAFLKQFLNIMKGQKKPHV